MTDIVINYSKSSEKFLAKNETAITENEVDSLIVKAVKNIFFAENHNVDLKRLAGYKPPCYRIRAGKVRIVFLLEKNKIIVVDVMDIDFRGNVYKK